MESGRTDHMQKWAAQFSANCKDKGLRTMFAEYGYTAGTDTRSRPAGRRSWPRTRTRGHPHGAAERELVGLVVGGGR